MIWAWFFIGFLVVLFAIWDFFYRGGPKQEITNGELVSAVVLLTVFGPLSVVWAVIYELDRAGVFSKIKNWWNRGVQ